MCSISYIFTFCLSVFHICNFLRECRRICKHLISSTPDGSSQFMCPTLSTFVFTLWWFTPLYCMAFPLLMRIDGVPGSLWEEKPSVSVSPSGMNNEWEWIRWLNCFILMVGMPSHRSSGLNLCIMWGLAMQLANSVFWRSCIRASSTWILVVPFNRAAVSIFYLN